MKNHGLRFLTIGVLIALCAWAAILHPVKKGLDLAGGTSIAYQIIDTQGEGSLTDDDLKRIISVLEKRLNASGLLEINIVPTDQAEILIEIPGRDSSQVESIKNLLQQSGELEFRMMAPESKITEETKNREQGGEYYNTPADLRWVPYRNGGGDGLVRVPEGPLKAKWDALQRKKDRGQPVDEQELQAARDAYLEMHAREYFTGAQLRSTSVVKHGQTGEWVVSFEFKTEFREAFRRFTERNVKNQMAIILDGQIDSAPVIRSTLPGGGIIEGGGNGGFSIKEAEELSIVLASGATGVELKELRQETLGPSLGEDAIHRGQLSILAGFISVLLIMVWLYRGPGLIANLALLLNVVILIGVLAFFRAALSLPGIAGIVLTLGMAVDANILIFERIKEEKERGKSLIEAVASGYDRALVAILDANATTILTALVLISIGSGAVKGFGVTLTVGILASMFTAIFVTRAVFDWLIDKGIMKELKMGADRTVPSFNYMKARKLFTGPTMAFMLVGFAFFLARDETESKDLEFTGGVQMIVQTADAMDYTDAFNRAVGPNKEYLGVKVIELDTPSGSRFRISYKSVGAESDAAAPAPRETDESDVGEDAGEKTPTVDPDTAAGEAFIAHIRAAFDDAMVPPKFTGFTFEPGADGGVGTVSTQLNVATQLGDGGASLQEKLTATEGIQNVKLEPISGNALAYQLSFGTVLANQVTVQDRIIGAAEAAEPRVILSDPMPAVSFLNPSRAEELWRGAMQAVMLAMVFQVLYIRLRFADYKHGFAAVCALVHDTVIALGCVAIMDASGLVNAKINLVLVAAFLTLIGYSMNDTIVVFDRIRENLGKGRLVLTGVVNESLNQTLTRSIRTSVTTWIVVLIQFVVNWRTGSVLEGFAFVMVIGVLMGTYSSIFIAAPLLLFLPIFWKKFASNDKVAWLRVIVSAIGAVVALKAPGHGVQMWVGIVFAVNIPLQFFYELARWLPLENPDDLLEEEIQEELDERPLVKPGI